MARININIDARINGNDKVILDLGSGIGIKKDRITIDAVEHENVDIVCDLEKGLPFFPDNSVDEIHSNHFLEHVENFDVLMNEITRVLKRDAVCYITVPHFCNPYFYSDPTHRRTFGLYTFFYFCKHSDQMTRKVPNYYTKARIQILSQRLNFKSPFKYRNYFKRVVGKIINSSPYLQEFYEENFCYLIPCYELQISFKAIK